MQQMMGVDQETLNDAGLIALLSQTEKEIEERGESKPLNLLLRDFTRELLKHRLLEIVEFIRRLGSSAASAESDPVCELNKLNHDTVSDVTRTTKTCELNLMFSRSDGGSANHG